MNQITDLVNVKTLELVSGDTSKIDFILPTDINTAPGITASQKGYVFDDDDAVMYTLMQQFPINGHGKIGFRIRVVSSQRSQDMNLYTSNYWNWTPPSPIENTLIYVVLLYILNTVIIDITNEVETQNDRNLS